MTAKMPGLLAVLSEPGTRVTLEEFQDWYNNEHVPLRMNKFLSFLTGARFYAVDSFRPSWLALYDLDDRKALWDPTYTKLRQERSPREADLVSRLETLQRKECILLTDSGQSTVTSSLAFTNPTKNVITHGLVTGQNKSIDGWNQDIIHKLRNLEGWLRTRVFLVDMDPVPASSQSSEGDVPSKYLVLHELEDRADVEAAKFEGVIRSHEQFQITELRRWSLYRSYPGIAQGNL